MVNDVRLRNLYLLAYEYCSQAALAEALNIEYTEIVKYFKNKSSPITEQFARRIEAATHKPRGWMDRDNLGMNLTSEEWQLVETYRSSGERDKLLLHKFAKLISD